MKNWTWLELKTKIENDLDLVDEIFITPAELLGYANEAIDEAEQEVLTIYEDYFLTSVFLPLVTGTDVYALPDDIWAHKIRQILYRSGSKRYQIKRVKELKDLNNVETTDEYYRYLLVNSLSAGPQIQLHPTARETSAENITIWFIRNAKEIVLDTDTIDIPEGHKFITQHIKLRCYEKEGSVNQEKAQLDLERERKLLIDSLSAMIPDEDNFMEMDTSFYDDFYSELHRGNRSY